MLVEKVARGACERHIRRVRRHDTDPATLEEMLPGSVDYAWREHADEARAAIEAVFDEMAEPGEEALRMAVALFHVMARTRIPNYELPADSQLEATARGIWTAMLAAKRKEALP